MKYGKFNDDVTDDDIMLMLYNGHVNAVCWKCGEDNSINPDEDEFSCSFCDTVQGSPLLNPEEIEKER